MKIRRPRLAGAAVTLLIAAGMVVGAGSAANATDSSVSVAAYCARNVGSGTLAPSQAVNINNRWDGWRCGTRTGLVSVDMQKACTQQYGNRAKAVTVNTRWDGWRCRY